MKRKYYKVVRVVDGKYYSAAVKGRVALEYRLRRKTTGHHESGVFCFRTLAAAKDFLSKYLDLGSPLVGYAILYGRGVNVVRRLPLVSICCMATMTELRKSWSHLSVDDDWPIKGTIVFRGFVPEAVVKEKKQWAT